MPTDYATSKKTPPTPSGSTGLQALQALLRHKTPLAALEVFHQDLGDIFQINMPGFRPVVLAGPEAGRFVLVTARHKLRWRAEGEPVTRLLRHGVLVADGAAHDELRRQMDPALHRQMLAGYVAQMWQLTDRVTGRWESTHPLDMLVEMRRVALLILMQTLFGVDFGPHLERLWQPVLRTIAYISPGAWLLWRNIPRPGYKKALQQLDAYLYQIIRERRAAGAPTDDLLGLLVSAPGMSDDLIRDQMLTMLIAGHDTSTALLAWTLYLLGRHPEILARVQAEVDDVLGSALPDYTQVNRLKFLDQVVKESLRLYPPIHASMRVAADDLNFQGVHIPAGTRLLYSIYLTQRQPQYWPQPEQFDPERFGPTQNQHRPAFTYVPFGGGPRNCIGATFGLVEAKVVLARIFQRFNVKLVQPNIHPHMGATLEPRPGVLVQVNRR